MNEPAVRRETRAAGLRLTVMLKRIAPFALTMIFSMLLVSLVPSGKLLTREATRLGARDSGHSRTWLYIHDVPAPSYTEKEAREKGATDTLRLRALLDADGTVSQVKQLSSATEDFVDDAISAAKRIKFRPATEDYRPISLWVTVDYSCSGYYFGHRSGFGCSASITEVERDWRIIHE